jgi:hypothetical protein
VTAPRTILCAPLDQLSVISVETRPYQASYDSHQICLWMVSSTDRCWGIVGRLARAGGPWFHDQALQAVAPGSLISRPQGFSGTHEAAVDGQITAQAHPARRKSTQTMVLSVERYLL